MTQLPLVIHEAPTVDPSPQASEQVEQLARVADGIERTVFTWCSHNIGRSFHLAEFTTAVQAAHNGYVAPDSPARLLRLLRQRGLVKVALLSRSSSLYRVDGVAEGA